jgi:hypothetical protein
LKENGPKRTQIMKVSFHHISSTHSGFGFSKISHDKFLMDLQLLLIWCFEQQQLSKLSGRPGLDARAVANSKAKIWYPLDPIGARDTWYHLVMDVQVW